MPRKKKGDLGEIVARAQQLRADIDTLAADMREITHRLVLSVLTKEPKAKRRGRPLKARKKGRPSKARKVKPKPSKE